MGLLPNSSAPTGLVSNVVTKSGGNNFSGSVNYYLQSDSFVDNPSSDVASSSGIAVKDKLWFFGEGINAAAPRFDDVDTINITLQPINDPPVIVVPGTQSFFTDFDNLVSNPAPVNDPDSDGDGVHDSAEIELGTNPNRPTTFPRSWRELLEELRRRRGAGPPAPNVAATPPTTNVLEVPISRLNDGLGSIFFDLDLPNGLTADFIGATGLVSNVVTKSGGNNFSGSVNFYLENDDWWASDSAIDADVDDRSARPPAGVPTIKDKLWFFGGDPNGVGLVPDPDTDGDGVPDWAEVELGTNPNRPTTFPRSWKETARRTSPPPWRGAVCGSSGYRFRGRSTAGSRLSSALGHRRPLSQRSCLHTSSRPIRD